MNQSLIRDELELLDGLVDLAHRPRVIELGCGAAQLSRRLLERFPASEVTALEVDERQHAKNLASPQARLRFVQAGAQAIPFEDGCCDLALMLKSLHHVPLDLLDVALAEAHRVLRPDGLMMASLLGGLSCATAWLGATITSFAIHAGVQSASAARTRWLRACRFGFGLATPPMREGNSSGFSWDPILPKPARWRFMCPLAKIGW